MTDIFMCIAYSEAKTKNFLLQGFGRPFHTEIGRNETNIFSSNTYNQFSACVTTNIFFSILPSNSSIGEGICSSSSLQFLSASKSSFDFNFKVDNTSNQICSGTFFSYLRWHLHQDRFVLIESPTEIITTTMTVMECIVTPFKWGGHLFLSSQHLRSHIHHFFRFEFQSWYHSLQR